MCPDFKDIILAYGFNPTNYDFESTVAGWLYDVDAALQSDDSCFNSTKTEITRHPYNLNSLLRTQLQLFPHISIQTGIEFICAKWHSELYYVSPLREITDVSIDVECAKIHILTISKSNAMTLKFTINKP